MAVMIDTKNAENKTININPRESMRVLPSFVQPFLTWLTGKPLVGERPWGLRPVHHLMACLLPIAAGITVSVAAFQAGRWFLVALPPGWLLTTHGIRKLRTVILHQCSHRNFWRKPTADRLLGILIGILLISQDYDEYQREHIGDHHSNSHMTMEDPTVQFLVLTVGARGGMPKADIWKRMFRTLVSPSYHYKAMIGRVSSHFQRTSVQHKAALCLSVSTEIVVVTLTHAWALFAVVWLVPLTVLFNASALFRLSSRHVFPAPGARQFNRASLAGYTHGIFIGESAPSPELRGRAEFAAWTNWWYRMLLIHLPTRLFVLVGDGPCHDFHHRHPRAKNWPDYIFARAADESENHPGWPPYTEVWGLRAAIDACFDSLSNADSEEFRPHTETRLSAALLAAAIEE
jgi:hypothetical protein